MNTTKIICCPAGIAFIDMAQKLLRRIKKKDNSFNSVVRDIGLLKGICQQLKIRGQAKKFFATNMCNHVCISYNLES